MNIHKRGREIAEINVKIVCRLKWMSLFIAATFL